MCGYDGEVFYNNYKFKTASIYYVKCSNSGYLIDTIKIASQRYICVSICYFNCKKSNLAYTNHSNNLEILFSYFVNHLSLSQQANVKFYYMKNERILTLRAKKNWNTFRG